MATKKTEKPPAVPDRFISADEAHKLCGLTARFLKAELRAGRIAGKNLKGRRGWMLLESSLQQYIRSGNAPPPKTKPTAPAEQAAGGVG